VAVTSVTATLFYKIFSLVQLQAVQWKKPYVKKPKELVHDEKKL